MTGGLRESTKGPETKIVIGKGIASKTILSETQESEASLIAMSRRGEGGLRGCLLAAQQIPWCAGQRLLLMFPF